MEETDSGHVRSSIGRRPRVCIIGTHVTRSHSGTSQSTISIANSLARRDDVDVQVLAQSIEPGLLDQSIGTRVIAPVPSRRLVWRIDRLLLPGAFAGALRVPLEEDADFDMCYTQYMEGAVAFRRLVPDVPLVTHFGHVLASQEAREVCQMAEPWRALDIAFASNLERRSYRLPLTTHVASTQLVAETRIAEFDLPPDFFRIQPLGVDHGRFHDHSRRREIRQALGIASTDVALVSVARMVGWKQLDWLVDAAGELPDRCHLILVGDGDERSSLECRLASSPARGRVHVIGHADPVPYLAAADIFALVSRIESFGLVYAEAMLMGLPCIGLRYAPPTVLSTAADVIADGATGYVVADRRELRDRWRLLAEDAGLRTRLGAAARARALQLFTSDAYAGFLRGLIATR